MRFFTFLVSHPCLERVLSVSDELSSIPGTVNNKTRKQSQKSVHPKVKKLVSRVSCEVTVKRARKWLGQNSTNFPRDFAKRISQFWIQGSVYVFTEKLVQALGLRWACSAGDLWKGTGELLNSSNLRLVSSQHEKITTQVKGGGSKPKFKVPTLDEKKGKPETGARTQVDIPVKYFWTFLA